VTFDNLQGRAVRIGGNLPSPLVGAWHHVHRERLPTHQLCKPLWLPHNEYINAIRNLTDCVHQSNNGWVKS
jgi:hypothetical protein